jgi:hypothetical protein
MKISEYVAALNALAAEHGDLDVETFDVSCNRVPAAPPRIEYRRILDSRKTKQKFWDRHTTGLAHRGDKVCAV